MAGLSQLCLSLVPRDHGQCPDAEHLARCCLASAHSRNSPNTPQSVIGMAPTQPEGGALGARLCLAPFWVGRWWERGSQLLPTT